MFHPFEELVPVDEYGKSQSSPDLESLSELPIDKERFGVSESFQGFLKSFTYQIEEDNVIALQELLQGYCQSIETVTGIGLDELLMFIKKLEENGSKTVGYFRQYLSGATAHSLNESAAFQRPPSRKRKASSPLDSVSDNAIKSRKAFRDGAYTKNVAYSNAASEVILERTELCPALLPFYTGFRNETPEYENKQERHSLECIQFPEAILVESNEPTDSISFISEVDIEFSQAEAHMYLTQMIWDYFSDGMGDEASICCAMVDVEGDGNCCLYALSQGLISRGITEVAQLNELLEERYQQLDCQAPHFQAVLSDKLKVADNAVLAENSTSPIIVISRQLLCLAYQYWCDHPHLQFLVEEVDFKPDAYKGLGFIKILSLALKCRIGIISNYGMLDRDRPLVICSECAEDERFTLALAYRQNLLVSHVDHFLALVPVPPLEALFEEKWLGYAQNETFIYRAVFQSENEEAVAGVLAAPSELTL